MSHEPSRPASLPTIVATAALIVASRAVAHACPVCFGASDSPMAEGMNAGVLVLLGVTVALLAGIAVVGWRIAGRARDHASLEQPGAAERST